MSSEAKKKKLLESPLAGSLVVPIAIVLVGAVVVFGVTKLLSTERSYKDLVREMHTKTFGNRWIAAFELSKLISSSQIPQEDIPWLIQNLNEIYDSAQDPRTRQFTVVAAGALQNEEGAKLLTKSIDDSDPKVRFHTIVALGNMPKNSGFKGWEKVVSLLNKDDVGLVQAAILALATHEIEEAEKPIASKLSSDNRILRFTAASALINYKNPVAREHLIKILELEPGQKKDSSLREQQVVAMKVNVINSLERKNWKILNSELENIAKQDKSVQVISAANEALKSLKN